VGKYPAETKSQGPICFNAYLYRARNLVERFFNRIKQCRRIATRYDKRAANYLAFIKLASIRYGCALGSPRPSQDGRIFKLHSDLRVNGPLRRLP
jgi:transposase